MCNLQLQGVNSSAMSQNIPTLSDTAWAVGGKFRQDFGGNTTTHYCVFTAPSYCALPETTDFSECIIRCFGYNFDFPAQKLVASERSVTDVYPGMGRWNDDGAVDLWSYPRNCFEADVSPASNCTYSGRRNQIPSYNPQGFTFTYSGSGTKGFLDGAREVARFNGPEDVAVDESGIIYVADTQNNAIRMVDLEGTVVTLAGRGPHHPGYADGPCKNATFVLPKGLDVRHETINGVDVTVVIVADTGNHRIRRIEYTEATGACQVTCLTGLCGNNSLSATEFKFPAVPLTGYADGNRLEARFSAPESVAFMEGDYFVVADTGNFLLRWVFANNGSTQTLAGHVVHGPKDPEGNPLPGCTPPCLAGQQGFRDGNLTYAEFYNPIDVTRGPNNTLWVADEQRIRILALPGVVSEFYTIRSMGRVSTIAGTSLQGHDDGIADKANFFYSSSVFVTPDNIAYVADSATCRIRRITPFPSVAEHITCSARAAEFIRPSGCTTFDQPVDKIGRKVSRVERNIQYNFGFPYELDKDKGKYIKNCVGIPPHDLLDKRFVNITGDNLVIDDLRTEVNEDSEQGMAILVSCPAQCGSDSSGDPYVLEGNGWYSETSSICMAALHDGQLTNRGGLVQITFERLDYLSGPLRVHLNGTLQNSIVSTDISRRNTSRVFSIVSFNVSNSMVHTVSGNPSAPLESGCGFEDALTPMDAKFNLPSGTAARYGFNLSDSVYLYIADTSNNRIRALSATCTQICENGGRCVGPDICECPEGWEGVDCTKPVCTSTCGPNTVCVAPPNVCACKPGFSGPDCTIPLCQQHCYNNGTCSAPDTCKCPPGWFDSNCTTPVCDNTCANGGNCTAPGTCACPKEWTGPDCRTPVCKQVCQNQGYCVAPNTCICPPQFTGVNCSIPVCTQGYFKANSGVTQSLLFPTFLQTAPIYKNCDLQSWCNATNEFECDQAEIAYGAIRVPSGPEFRAITGRKTPPNQCMNIELPINFKVPYQLLFSDNTTTGHVRYSPISPYTSNPNNAWRGYTQPTVGRTGPWTYQPDRQVANVNWLNVTQGLYVCANGGACIAPDVCACAEGWIGFDCRTPVCNQGYYFPEQTDYVSGQKTPDEIELFQPYFGNNNYTLYWNYSNPNFTIQFEFYEGPSNVTREVRVFEGKRYFQEMNDVTLQPNLQGGYRCSIRANTEWESIDYVFDHPNFFSQYMDTEVQDDKLTYTHWKNMRWPPLHRKSRILDRIFANITYIYTNEGYRRRGIWSTTGREWAYGICVMEFYRNCSGDPRKQYDVESMLSNVFVQDTDLAYRPRITYNDLRVSSRGRWKEAGGVCVDNVIRGCANNGTCIAPNTCRCAPGWTDSHKSTKIGEQFGDCRKPICEQECKHNGNCTSPNICTCERGWSGFDCSIPLCAQECQNGGMCVAPDVCKCNQWPNTFRDGRVAGGRPLFQDEFGNPLNSGWTGYDCSVPICVQAEKFLLNVPNTRSQGYVLMGGHGGDSKLTCTENGLPIPRCPQFDEYVTGNDGRSFQTGCGWDPFQSKCCDEPVGNEIKCYSCSSTANEFYLDNHYYCDGEPLMQVFSASDSSEPVRDFQTSTSNWKICGKYHNPRFHAPRGRNEKEDYGVPTYYFNVLEGTKSSFNFRSNLTSNQFLCNVRQWEQGDYIDDAGMGSLVGAGSMYGLKMGRHNRTNTVIINLDPTTQTFTRGEEVPGEGVYRCYNLGSCIAPDICTCTDGYEGDDCIVPLCRHLQVTGAVSACLNGGLCSLKDRCDCVQTDSVLWKVHPLTNRGLTGWTGTDCSMPICMQGYYDPFCGDLPQAPGGQGCYRCANNGNCTAPDTCTCAPGWTGFDCKTPVCEVVADPLTRTQLGTVFEDKVIAFESDPCGVTAIYGKRGWKGTKYNRGNCTEPDRCTCLCKVPYRRKSCHKTGKLCDGPWQDNMVSQRNLPGARGPEFTFGSTDCYFGYEGNIDDMNHFTTCHQTIYVPSSVEEQSLSLIISFAVIGLVLIVVYRYASVRLKRRFLLAKIERRRTRRDSEASMQSGERSSLMRESI